MYCPRSRATRASFPIARLLTARGLVAAAGSALDRAAPFDGVPVVALFAVTSDPAATERVRIRPLATIFDRLCHRVMSRHLEFWQTLTPRHRAGYSRVRVGGPSGLPTPLP